MSFSEDFPKQMVTGMIAQEYAIAITSYNECRPTSVRQTFVFTLLWNGSTHVDAVTTIIAK